VGLSKGLDEAIFVNVVRIRKRAIDIEFSRFMLCHIAAQVIGWDRGRPARNAPKARSLLE